MKTIKYVAGISLFLFLAAGLALPSKVQAQPGVTVSFQVFFQSLTPYGRWSDHPRYGSVWFPSVGRDFHPYSTDGRWVMTEYGNTWVSDYDWGWAPFHYGRWFYDDFYGWAWVPGYDWGPGWVNWRTGGGYYGWAPLLPGLDVRISVNLPVNFWIFVPQRHFMSRDWHRYCAPRTRVHNVYQQTTIINNYYIDNRREYAYGPRSSDIERYSRQKVTVYDYSRGNNNGRYRDVVTRNRSSQDVVLARERHFDNPGTGPRTGGSRSGLTENPGRGRSSYPDGTSEIRSGRTGTTSGETPEYRTGTNPRQNATRGSAEGYDRGASSGYRSNSGEGHISTGRASEGAGESTPRSSGGVYERNETPGYRGGGEGGASPAYRSGREAGSSSSGTPARRYEGTSPGYRGGNESSAPSSGRSSSASGSSYRSEAPSRSGGSFEGSSGRASDRGSYAPARSQPSEGRSSGRAAERSSGGNSAERGNRGRGN